MVILRNTHPLEPLRLPSPPSHSRISFSPPFVFHLECLASLMQITSTREPERCHWVLPPGSQCAFDSNLQGCGSPAAGLIRVPTGIGSVTDTSPPKVNQGSVSC